MPARLFRKLTSPTRGKKIPGCARYDATAPDFFGPYRVLDEEQGGASAALLLVASRLARAEGYAYAVIGGESARSFTKVCGAMPIPDFRPQAYQDFLGGMKDKKDQKRNGLLLKCPPKLEKIYKLDPRVCICG
ncbi:MAG: hypothetical protein ACLVEX_02465 [Ruthenibacterium lactatiformans]